MSIKMPDSHRLLISVGRYTGNKTFEKKILKKASVYVQSEFQ
jgi:hypothetical protein